MGQAIGIDFGTTNTVVSYQNSRGHLQQVKYGRNKDILIPTALFFNTKNDYIIGRGAKAKGTTKPAALVEKFKTRLGNKDNRPYNVVAANGEKRKLTPSLAMALFLNRLIKDVNDSLQNQFADLEEGRVDRAVITVPAKFGPEEIKSIKTAAMRALGIDSQYIKAVPEPTAAARAAHEDEKEKNGETVLIYDFGGGTFDVSVMRYDNNKYREILTDGQKNLGGNNLTDKLAAILMENANGEYGTDYTMSPADYDPDDCNISQDQYKENIFSVWEAAEDVKKQLSEEGEATAEFNFWHSETDSDTLTFFITQEQLLDLIQSDLDTTVDITARTVENAPEKIDRIIMAGGSSRIPAIRDILAKRLERQDIEVSDDVSTLISRGAALFAQVIGDVENLTEQVTKNRMGVAVTEGVQLNKFHTIIGAGVKLPASGTKVFRLLEDDMTELNVAYYEHDVKNYPNAQFIDEPGIEEAAVIPIGLPPGLKKADTMVEVTFAAQIDGSMEFSARVLDNNGQEKAVGKPVIIRQDGDLL